MLSEQSGTSTRSQKSASNHVVAGRRYGHLIRLKPEYQERYIALHAHPFPGLIRQLRASGLRNYSIFLHDDMLFSFYEYVGDDYAADMEAIAENDTVQDWWTLTDPMQTSLGPDDSDQWWTPIQELWHGGEKTVATSDSQLNAQVTILRNGALKSLHEVYSEVGPDLEAALEEAHVQNYTVFGWQEQLHTYFEYTGGHFADDYRRLRASSVMQQLQRELSRAHAEGAIESRKEVDTEPVFFMR